MTEPEIRKRPKTILIGIKKQMSVTANSTQTLWQEFMPAKTQIPDTLGTDLYSVEVYDALDYFKEFDPGREFEKWAAVPVKQTGDLPENMEELILPEGLYAVFKFQGMARDAWKIYQYIYASWIPNSEYSLDHRPHFSVMGEDYNPDDPSSKELIWIPVKR